MMFRDWELSHERDYATGIQRAEARDAINHPAINKYKPLQKRTAQTKMLIVPRLRNPGLDPCILTPNQQFFSIRLTFPKVHQSTL